MFTRATKPYLHVFQKRSSKACSIEVKLCTLMAMNKNLPYVSNAKLLTKNDAVRSILSYVMYSDCYQYIVSWQNDIYTF